MVQLALLAWSLLYFRCDHLQNASMRGSDMSENQGSSRQPDQAPTEVTEPAFGENEKHESAMEDVPPAPTWPLQVPDPAAEQAAPPVGMNWGAVAEQLGIELRAL